ncbi:MAG: PhzF family phenazine biosynthesis protein [Acidobacteria bacterium]|nr:PhzF family phenazine biosynthesis protein [Acidobacteriota bacterium]
MRFHTLDVFTSRRFAGNPLAVVLDADGLSTDEMQSIAREFNLSETIFVMAPADSANTAKVRIFFPNGEIPFAGHPTVGCAILLATERGALDATQAIEIRLEEEAGLVPVIVTTGPNGVPQAIFTAPIVPYELTDVSLDVTAIARASGLDVDDIGFGDHRPRLHKAGPGCLHVPVRTRAALAKAQPMEPHWSTLFNAIGTDQGYFYTPGGDDPGTAYRARMFAPTAMTPEDPATGSATAMLAAQLLTSEHLTDGTHRWQLEQGYEMGRPSDLHLQADVEGGRLTAVRVSGQAVRVMSGELAR